MYAAGAAFDPVRFSSRMRTATVLNQSP